MKIFYLIFCLFIRTNANRKPLLVVSFDGLRADKFDEFVSKNPKSAFSLFINNGVKAEYMEPVFPSSTYPNHMSLVTGLFPESHGVILNSLYDPKYDSIFTFTSPKNPYEIQWWNQSEPIWMTAKKQGIKTASMMWIGTDIITRTPDIYIPYDDSYPFIYRIDDVVNYISKLKVDLTFLYFEEPDAAGHIFGPESEEYRKKIIEMDRYFGLLIEKLSKANVYNDLNIIIVSDHGIAQTNIENNILLFDYVDEGKIDMNKTVEYETLLNIYPTPGNEEVVYESLKKIQNTQVYYKHEIPKEYHYSNNDRIAPIVLIVDEGYTVTMLPSPYLGNHGYSTSLPSMRAIFLAHGPSFKSNKTMKPFKSIDIYSLICDLSNIKCLANNGSIKAFKQILTNSSSVNSIKLYFSLSLISLFFTLKQHFVLS